MQHNLHSYDCACWACVARRHPHPTDHRRRLRAWAMLALWVAMFWAFPGRWIASAAITAITNLYR